MCLIMQMVSKLQQYILDIHLKEFASAHRLLKGYQGICRNLHGHNYKVQLVLSSTVIDDNDIVLDFSIIKKVLNKWVDDNLDHAVIVASFDAELLEFVKSNQQKHYIIHNANTSAEVLAEHLFHQFQPLIINAGHDLVSLTKVQVYETATASASFIPA